MSTHNICFHGEIRKLSAFFGLKKRPICCYDLSVKFAAGKWELACNGY